jgi:hypothetical protein
MIAARSSNDMADPKAPAGVQERGGWIRALGAGLALLLLLGVAAASALQPARLDGLRLYGLDVQLHIPRDMYYARELAAGRFPAVRRSMINWSGHHPPLTYFLIGLWGLLLGARPLAVFASGAAFTVAYLLVVYLLGSRLVGRGAALIGCLLLLLTPQLHTYARAANLEIPLAFWTALSFLALERFGLDRLRHAPLHGLLAAAGLLTKFMFPLTWLPVIGFVLLRGTGETARPDRAGSRGRGLRRRLMSFILVVLVMLLVSAPWYAPRLGTFLRYFEDLQVDYAQESGLFKSDWGMFFLREWLDAYGWLVPLLLAAGALLDRRRLLGTRSRRLLWIWFLTPHLVMLAHTMSYSRSMIPAFAGGALLAGDTVRRWPRRRLALLPLVPALALAATLSLGLEPWKLRFVDLDASRGMLDLLGKAWRGDPDPTALIIVDNYHPTIDGNMMAYLAMLAEPQVRFGILDLNHNTPEMLANFRNLGREADVLIYLTTADTPLEPDPGIAERIVRRLLAAIPSRRVPGDDFARGLSEQISEALEPLLAGRLKLSWQCAIPRWGKETVLRLYRIENDYKELISLLRERDVQPGEREAAGAEQPARTPR